MTRNELISLIGDVLERVDVVSGSLSPNHPERPALNELRDQLDARQLQLVQQQFDENTTAFQSATNELKAVNKDLQKTLTDLEKLVNTIANLRRFVNAVNGVIGAVVPVFV